MYTKSIYETLINGAEKIIKDEETLLQMNILEEGIKEIQENKKALTNATFCFLISELKGILFNTHNQTQKMRSRQKSFRFEKLEEKRTMRFLYCSFFFWNFRNPMKMSVGRIAICTELFSCRSQKK